MTDPQTEQARQTEVKQKRNWKKTPGRWSAIDKISLKKLQLLTLDGWTDEKIAAFFDISISGLKAYKNKHPKLNSSLEMERCSVGSALSRDLGSWKYSPSRHGKNENELCAYIDICLPVLLASMGIKYKNIAREFIIDKFRCDYVIKTESNDFIILEVKHSDQERDFVSGIGQLLAYQIILSTKYNIQNEKIKLFLFLNKDSLISLNIIKENNLPIDLFIVGEKGIKRYGSSERIHSTTVI